ncbi:MAG: VOC family protein [Acidimicrobiales bacterium]
MEMQSYEHGAPSWVDVGCRDTAAGAAFYSALFGWDLQEGPPEVRGYAIAHLRDKAVAGLGPVPDPSVPPSWLTYINVHSADDVAEKVTASGGHTFMTPMDVLDVGRMAVFADPVGAVFGVWEARGHIGAQLINEPNTFCWSELLTSDVEASKAFYGAVFGWGSVTHAHSPEVPDAMAYNEWQLGGASIGGLMLKPPFLAAEVPSHWVVYFAVVDADETVARAKALGATVTVPPTEIEPGRFAVLADLDGASFAVIALKPELAG